MRYFKAISLTIVTILLSSSAISAPHVSKTIIDPVKSYSAIQPKQKENGLAQSPIKKLTMLPPTAITVINASVTQIYVTVPGSSIYDWLSPMTNDHIYNDFSSASTFLVLKDPDYNTFYSGLICHRAIVTVYGVPGSYRINIDSELCYQ